MSSKYKKIPITFVVQAKYLIEDDDYRPCAKPRTLSLFCGVKKRSLNKIENLKAFLNELKENQTNYKTIGEVYRKIKDSFFLDGGVMEFGEETFNDNYYCSIPFIEIKKGD
jgi:hypothetical protein